MRKCMRISGKIVRAVLCKMSANVQPPDRVLVDISDDGTHRPGRIIVFE